MPTGELTITATQNINSATATLTVVTPILTLDSTSEDNSVARIITAEGENFGAEGSAVTLTVTAPDPEGEDGDVPADGDVEGVPVEGVTFDPATAMTDDENAFSIKVTLPAGTEPGDLTFSATSNDDDYTDDAAFELRPAPPAQVQNVVVTGGERSLAVTWTKVEAVDTTNDANTADEKRPAADGYKVEWTLAVRPTWPKGNVQEVTGGGLNYHTVSNVDLIPGQQYMVRVSATSEGTADGEPSDIDKDAIGVPTALTRGELENRDDLGATINATNSDTPGGRVRVELEFHADHEVNLSDRIVVDFGSFGVPDSIDENRVDLRVWGRDDHDGETRQPYEGNPDDVTVDGSEVTLVLGTLENDNATPATVNRIQEGAEVKITFRESAGITNPTTAKDDEGNYSIGIDADGPIGRTADDDGEYPDRNFGSVVRKVSVSPTSASRGSEITVTGKGFGSGTASVFLDDKAGDTDLSREVAITSGSFEVTLDVGADFNAGRQHHQRH